MVKLVLLLFHSSTFKGLKNGCAMISQGIGAAITYLLPVV